MSIPNNQLAPENESWNEQKNRLKSRFLILTDEDLNFDGSNYSKMIISLQEKLGITEEELREIIAGL